MRNRNKAIAGAAAALSLLWMCAAAETDQAALADGMQVRRLIVNLIVVLAVWIVYYGKKMKLYRFGDVREQIANEMAKKCYGRANPYRELFRHTKDDAVSAAQRNMEELQRQQMEEVQRRQNEWTMDEARKAVTPFDHGGYVQGAGFNPSDTMAAESQRRQMDAMGSMNHTDPMGPAGML